MHRPPRPPSPGSRSGPNVRDAFDHTTSPWPQDQLPRDVAQPAGCGVPPERPPHHHGGHPPHHGQDSHWNGPNSAGASFPQQHYPQPEHCEGERIYPYNRPPKHTLIALINVENKTDFSPEQLNFGQPSAIGNTLTHITAYPSEKTGWTDQVELTYNRQYLETYLGMTHVHLYTDATMSKESVIQAMKDRYRIWLEPSDFDMEMMGNQPTWLQRGQYLMRLRFTCNSLIWIGAIEVIVIPDNRLCAVLINTNLSGFIYPANMGRRKQLADSFYSSLDGTILWDTLRLLREGQFITPGPKDRGGRWAAGYRITGDEWVFDQNEVEFNIAGAKVAYNGRNEGRWFTGDSRLSHVLVIELSNQCKNLRGKLIIPYDIRRENPCG